MAEQQEQFEAVVNAVREQGFVVEEVIEEIATLVGSVEDEELDRIRHIQGSQASSRRSKFNCLLPRVTDRFEEC